MEARAQLPWACETSALYDALRIRLGQEPKILKTPAPVVETIEHNVAGPVAVIRLYCAPVDYGDVFFLTQQMVGEEIRKAGIVAPNPAPSLK